MSAEIGSSPVVSTRLTVDLGQVYAQLAPRLRPDGLQKTGRPLLGRDSEQEPGHLLRPVDRASGRERFPATIGNECHPGGEDRHQPFQVPRGGRLQEALCNSALLALVGLEAGPPLANVLTGEPRELPDRLLLASEDVCDL
jgi:hypothetical protein